MSKLIHGDCLDVMARGTENTFDAIVTDPPYGLKFMGKEWDHGVPGVPFWEQAFRVTKPGGTLLAFGGTRTHHRLMTAIEDAGWELRDCLMWLYGTGFPKSFNIAKGMDRQKYSMSETLEVTRWVNDAIKESGKTYKSILEHLGFNPGSGQIGHWTALTIGSQPTVPTLEQVPILLDFLGATPPDRIADLMWTLNSSKGKPGSNWFKREVVGHRQAQDFNHCGPVPAQALGIEGTVARKGIDITAPATDDAKTWEGYGTALKPAWEPIIMAMKPCDGTFAQNALTHGNAGLNIDGCRIGTQVKPQATNGEQAGGKSVIDYGDGLNNSGRSIPHTQGRWPANVILDEEAGASLDEQSGIKKDGVAVNRNRKNEKSKQVYGDFNKMRGEDQGHGGSGGASRFFYTAKASKKERNLGCEDLLTWESAGLSQEVEELLSLARGMSDDTLRNVGRLEWSTMFSGSGKTDQFQKVFVSTIEMTTKLITSLRTFSSSLTSNTSASIRDAIRAMPGSGSNLVESAESISQWLQGTTSGEMESALRAVLALFDVLSRIRGKGRLGNVHSTVKPLALMRWLCRLVKTPTGGKILDPFMGSGTTGIAAREEGMEFVGIEQDAEHYETAKRRIEDA